MAKNKNLAESVVWNLNDFYRGINDPAIKKDKQLVEKLTRQFIKKYKGKINKKSLTAKFLLQAIEDVEKLDEKLIIYVDYASYLHSQDTQSPKVGSFYQEASEFSTKITADLLWFSLEIQQLSEKQAKEIINSPLLSEYKHYLEQLRVFGPFKKTLPEEEIITKMGPSGAQSFVRLFDQISSAETFEFDGKKITYPEIASLMKDDPKTENRKKASVSFTNTYKDNQKLYTFILNTLLLNKKIMDEIRGYKYPQQSTFLGYEVDPKVVESLVKSVKANYSLCERFYKTKSRILGRKLYEWDRYSSLSSEKREIIPWEKAKEIVLSSFRKFDPEFEKIAKLFFENGWIDAKISSTKRDGAFCSYATPSKHPVVLMSYTGTVDDVMTLAHELGHGIHAYLSRSNVFTNYWPSTATAEIASIFAESLVFEHLYQALESKSEKLNLLANKIQGSFATIFRQIAFYLFETEIHEFRRKKGELSTDNFNEFFQTHLQRMFGNGLKLTENHKSWWMPVLHFYHYNFYVFTYAFGEALTLSLYQKYKVEKESFVTNYKNALKAGGSMSPSKITSLMGVDISKPNFWQTGINLLEKYVLEFENLAK